MLKITAPGIYHDVAAADYFADPAPQPSLTQSIAKILLDQSPLHAWHAHPRLNPDYRHDDDTKFDVGNIAHAMMLGRGKEIVVLEHDDWRTKAAKEAREAAAKEGKLAVLGKKYALADRMVRAAREQLELRGFGNLFHDGGDSEIVLAWHEGNFWLRQMIDWLSQDRTMFADYKTTEMSAAAVNLDRMMVKAGWHIQAAMAERGLDVLDPDNSGRRTFLFVVQECDPPYALNIAEITEGPMTMGRKMLEWAVTRWELCMAQDRWPGYPVDVIAPQFPSWMEQQWLEREVNERPADLMMAG